jgi:starch phosphorylase
MRRPVKRKVSKRNLQAWIDTEQMLDILKAMSGLMDASHRVLLQRLESYALRLGWSWSWDGRAMYQELAPDAWNESNGNPMAVVKALEAVELGEETRHALDMRLDTLEAELEPKQCPLEGAPEKAGFCVAYFCAEYGITEALPIYSGGLGVLAGDHLKSAHDLALPMVAIGLAYRHGYFHQTVSRDGEQEHGCRVNHFQGDLPATLCVDDEGTPLIVEVSIAQQQVQIQVWQVQVGSIRLFLLDTDLPTNTDDDRRITDQLYSGKSDHRFVQEIVLGIGGFRVLDALNIRPSVYHMNEGHSAFMALERMAKAMASTGASFDDASRRCSRNNLFTTHTPVAAGFDIFTPEQMKTFLPDMPRRLGLGWEAFLRLGAQPDDDHGEDGFNMALLALRSSGWVNGVSRLHGHVSRNMWQYLWPTRKVEEVPIGHVTNGIHLPTWTAPAMAALLEDAVGPHWPTTRKGWDVVSKIDDRRLWGLREEARRGLVRYTREQLSKRAERLGGEVGWQLNCLDPSALTIGFARRFATYKRATLLLRDSERLRKLLLDTEKPIQFIFAGKAHPRDLGGQAFLRDVVSFSQQEDVRHRFVFLEGYDMGVARQLVQGVDVWLNTPRRPKEASGTSGMKVLANGGLNLSILDGWWAEGYDQSNGWAIGSGEVHQDSDQGDRNDAEELFTLLETEIVPRFYEREDGLPVNWLAMVKASMTTLVKAYSGHRMVLDYLERFYLPAHRAGLKD